MPPINLGSGYDPVNAGHPAIDPKTSGYPVSGYVPSWWDRTSEFLRGKALPIGLVACSVCHGLHHPQNSCREAPSPTYHQIRFLNEAPHSEVPSETRAGDLGTNQSLREAHSGWVVCSPFMSGYLCQSGSVPRTA
jgi:hypothetical protein